MKYLVSLLAFILLTACHNKKSTEVELRHPDRANYIYLPVSVNGKNGFFLFDTGTTRTTVNADWAEGLGIEITDSVDVDIAMLYGVKKRRVSEKVYVRIGDVGRYQACLVEQDSLYKQINVDGIIGMDIISRYYWQFDLANHRVKIANQPIERKTAVSQPVLKLTYNRSTRKTPVFPVTLNDSLFVNLLFDTGNSINYLNINGVRLPEEVTFNFYDRNQPLHRKLDNQPAPGNTNVYIDDQYTGIHYKELKINEYPVSGAFIGIEVHDYHRKGEDLGRQGYLGIWFVRRFSTMYIDPFRQEVEFSVSPQDTTRYIGVQGFDRYMSDTRRAYFYRPQTYENRIK